MNTKYDKQLKAIKHYQKFPQMLPFIGSDYDNICNGKVRIFVLGESHYFPKNSVIHKDAEKWYHQITEKDLNEEEKDWINTREILMGDWEPQSHKIYENINDALAEFDAFNKIKRPIDGIAFMNAFLRPANEGKGIEPTELDISESAKVINEIIKIIQPTLVIFASKKAWDKLQHLNHKNKNYTHYPIYHRWLREKGKYGKEKFIQLIKEELKKRNCGN